MTARTIVMVGLWGVCALGVSAAHADMMYDPDYHARWWGGDTGWEELVDDLDVLPPVWQNANHNLHVSNMALAPPWHKDVIVEAYFTTLAPVPTAQDRNLWITGPGGIRFDMDEFLITAHRWTVTWHLPSQDAYEVIHWGSNAWGYGLTTAEMHAITYVDVGTLCTPEPGALALLAAGAVVMLRKSPGRK